MNAGKQHTMIGAQTQTPVSDHPEAVAHEPIQHVPPHVETPRRHLPLISKERLKTPSRATRGDESDRMSLQRLQSPSRPDDSKAAWEQQIGAAKAQWGKLSDEELLPTRGHTQQLVSLVQERYAITRDEAAAQIDRFFEKHRS